MIIPYRDRDAIYIFPVMTFTLILINVLVFTYELYLSAVGGLGIFYGFWGMTPYRVTAYLSLLTGLTFVTSQFIHADWLHLIGNMLYLMIFGNNIEARLGPIPFLFFYLTCGFIASIAHTLAYPASPIPTIGASGAIAGVLGAYLVTYPHGRIKTLLFFFYFRTVNVPAWILLGVWFLMQLFRGIGSLNADLRGGGIAYWAHIGGFAIGALVLLLVNALDPDGEGR